MKVRHETRFPRDERGNALPMIRVARSCEVEGPKEARAAAIDVIEALMTPASQRQIEGWLAELAVLVVKRPGSEIAESLRIEAYAARLRRYPADVARAALLDAPGRYWPTWAEVEERCEALVSGRRVMLAALRREDREEAPPEPRERVSAVRASEIMREILGRDVGGG